MTQFNNSQLAKYQESRNRPDYKLYTRTGTHHQLRVTSKDKSYLQSLAENWKALDMIDDYTIMEV